MLNSRELGARELDSLVAVLRGAILAVKPASMAPAPVHNRKEGFSYASMAKTGQPRRAFTRPGLSLHPNDMDRRWGPRVFRQENS